MGAQSVGGYRNPRTRVALSSVPGSTVSCFCVFSVGIVTANRILYWSYLSSLLKSNWTKKNEQVSLQSPFANLSVSATSVLLSLVFSFERNLLSEAAVSLLSQIPTSYEPWKLSLLKDHCQNLLVLQEHLLVAFEGSYHPPLDSS